MKKLFIFEGPDGCGKSTQVKLFADKLIALGKKVKLTREPGGTDLGEKIRDILLNSDYDLSLETQAYLFAAARRAHNEQIVEWINEGYTVICDRHILSSLAYQTADYKAKTREGSEEIVRIKCLNDIAMRPLNDLFDPMLCNTSKDIQMLYFQITPETMVQRSKNRSKERSLDNVEQNYTTLKDAKALIDRYDVSRKYLDSLNIVTIDANRDVEEIHQDIINLL